MTGKVGMGYQRSAVFTLIPSQYFCIIPPPFAPIFLLSVSLGIPSQLLCLYQRDILAIKSSLPSFSYLREIKVGSFGGAFWGLPLSYYPTRVSLPSHPLCHYAQYFGRDGMFTLPYLCVFFEELVCVWCYFLYVIIFW